MIFFSQNAQSNSSTTANLLNSMHPLAIDRLNCRLQIGPWAKAWLTNISQALSSVEPHSHSLFSTMRSSRDFSSYFPILGPQWLKITLHNVC